MKAIVCGGGIGGLAAAIALRRVGVEVEVYERAAEIREIGAGITMWANAVKGLRALGVADAVLEAGDPLRHVVTTDPDGEILNQSDLDEVSEKHGAPSVCVPRGALQTALYHALPHEIVHTGREIVRVEQDARSVRATFADGASVAGDFLIAADGVHSAVRASMLPGVQPRYAGYTSWRGIVPDDRGAGLEGRLTGRFGVGSGVQTAILRCGHGRLYWFVTANTPGGGRDPAGGHRAAALTTFASWKEAGHFRAVLERTPEEAIVRADIHELPHLERWTHGRVTLLGDAAHATTPNLGQGGGMAIEDAVVLADVLRGARDPVPALAAYEATRRERTRFIVDQSHTLGWILQLQNPLAVGLRDFLMKTRMSQKQSLDLFHKLFEWEPPEL
jgi:2-polyprenyl-6-methoxyphenol hydroxylase-like FAD-dependent oxidoreductase